MAHPALDACLTHAANPYRIHLDPHGSAQVWQDIGAGAEILIARFAVPSEAEKWVVWKVGRSL